MATLLGLDGVDALCKFRPTLSRFQFEDRQVFVLPHVRDWIVDVLPSLGSCWNIEVSPTEQLDEMLNRFCAGEAMAIPRDFHPLHHVNNGIWELKTADVRMFGFFHQQDQFVATDGDLTATVKEKGLYAGYCAQGARRRAALDLDEPKFLAGGEPHVVVSNYYCA